MRFFVIIIFVFLINNPSKASGGNKAHFAGGCFWCVEESFEKLNGVVEVISGYSGGSTENPTYKEVTYGNTGHFEVVEIIYNKEIRNQYLIVKDGQLAGMGAHSYSKGSATGGSEEAAKYKKK